MCSLVEPIIAYFCLYCPQQPLYIVLFLQRRCAVLSSFCAYNTPPLCPLFCFPFLVMQMRSFLICLSPLDSNTQKLTGVSDIQQHLVVFQILLGGAHLLLFCINRTQLLICSFFVSKRVHKSLLQANPLPRPILVHNCIYI